MAKTRVKKKVIKILREVRKDLENYLKKEKKKH